MDPEIRAERARQLLDDELLREALAAIVAEEVELLSHADLADPAALQRHAAAIQAARQFREHLQSVVTTGARAKRTPTGVA